MLVGSRVQFGDLFPVSTVSEAGSHEGRCSCDAHCSCLCGASSAVRHFKGIIWPDLVNIRDWWRIDSMITGVIGLSQRWSMPNSHANYMLVYINKEVLLNQRIQHIKTSAFVFVKIFS